MVGADLQEEAALRAKSLLVLPKLNYSRLDQLSPISPVCTELLCVSFDKKS